MADDDPNKLLQLQQYKPQNQSDVSLGGQPLPPPPTAPPPQNDLATQMAALISNMQQSPGGGTVTVNQPAPNAPVNPTQPAPNAALQTVQNMQAGQSAANALSGATPGYSYTGPQGQKIDIAPRKAGERQPTGAPGPPSNDPLAQLAASIGNALNQPVAQPTTPRSPADARADYQLQRDIGNQANLDETARQDMAGNALIASRRVAQEFPGQDASMFPEGLSKTLPGGRTFRALPSGGYAITSAPTAASRAETIKRGQLFDQLMPVERDIQQLNVGKAGGTMTTADLQKLVARGKAETEEERKYRGRVRASGSDRQLLRDPSAGAYLY